MAEAFSGLGYVLRVLDSAADVLTVEGEVQIIAYPEGRSDAEEIWRDLTAGKVVFPDVAL